jgi:hypothetical protein
MVRQDCLQMTLMLKQVLVEAVIDFWQVLDNNC